MLELVAPEERQRRVRHQGGSPCHGAAGSSPRARPARRHWSSVRRASPRRTARWASERHRPPRTRRRPPLPARRGCRCSSHTTPSRNLQLRCPRATRWPGRRRSRPPRRRPRPARRRPAGHPRREAVDADVAAHIDTVIAMEPGDRFAHLGAETSDQRCGCTLEHHDVVAERLRGRRGFEADEPGADHDDAPVARRDLLAQRKCIVQRPQLVDMSECLVTCEATRTRPGGATISPSKDTWSPSARTTDRSSRSSRLAAFRAAIPRRGRRRRRAGAGGSGQRPIRPTAASWRAAADRRDGGSLRR